MTTENETGEHTHDGEIELVIPEWVRWVGVAFCVGVSAYILFDHVWSKRQNEKALAAFRVAVSKRSEQWSADAKPYGEHGDPVSENRANGQLRVESDESSAL